MTRRIADLSSFMQEWVILSSVLADGSISLRYCAYARGEGVDRDLNKAFELWKKSAEQGNLVAQTYLGLCYFTGDGVQPDPMKAVAIWTNAAEHGNMESRRYLGVAYLTGKGITRDRNRALQCFEAAAASGDKEAQKMADELRLDLSVEKNISDKNKEKK